MSFKEEVVKYFCHMSCKSGQSSSICFIVNGVSQEAHVDIDIRGKRALVGRLQTVGKSV